MKWRSLRSSSTSISFCEPFAGYEMFSCWWTWGQPHVHVSIPILMVAVLFWLLFLPQVPIFATSQVSKFEIGRSGS